MATTEEAVHAYAKDKFDRIDMAVLAGDADQAIRIIQEFADDGFPEVARAAAEEIVRIGEQRLAEAGARATDEDEA